MNRFQRQYVAWTAAACAHLAVVGCAHARPVTAAPTGVDGLSGDTALFAAVVRVSIDSNRFHLPIRVDPRPLKAGTDLATPESRVVVSADVVERRRLVLARMGVPMGDADPPPHCESNLSPHVTSEATKGCPKRAALIVELSLGRRTSQWAPPGTTDYVAIRVPELTLGPGGWSATSYEDIMIRRGGGWALVRRRAVMDTD